MSLLKQNITKKEQVDKIMSKLEFINNGNSKEYKVKVIHDSEIYAKELDSNNPLLGLYYLIL